MLTRRINIAAPVVKANYSLANTFASLRYRNYRLWFIGQLISLVGTWTQTTALGFLVYELTKSPAYLGYVNFASGVPSWLFTLWAGVVADRLPRRKLLIIIQSSMILPAAVLAALTFLGLVQPWHIMVLATLTGIAISFDAPVRQAFVPEMVDRVDLTNAIALNSSVYNSAVVIGPAVGGVLYALVGPAWCFTVNAVSYLAVVIALMMMRIDYVPQPASKSRSLRDMLVGLEYVSQNRAVLLIMVTISMVSIFGISNVTLMPAWAVEVLKGDAQTNGLILSARGAGALVASFIIATFGQLRYRGRLWAAGVFIMPVALIIFSFIRWLPFSLVVLFFVGVGFMFVANTSNALIQAHVPDELRGRVMSVFVLVFFGSFPIGSMVAGQLAEYLGEPNAVLISSLVLSAYVVILWLRFPEVRNLE